MQTWPLLRGGGGVVNWEKPLILLYHIKQLTAGGHGEICDKMWGMVQKWLGTTDPSKICLINLAMVTFV